MKLVYYLSLIFLLLVTSPTLLASVPVSIDTDGDGIEDSQDADAVLGDFSQSEEVETLAPTWMLIMPISMRPANLRPRSIIDRT